MDTDAKQMRDGHMQLVFPVDDDEKATSGTTIATPVVGLEAFSLLPEFERRVAVDRRAMALLLERPKMAMGGLFGAGGLGGLKLRSASAAKTAAPAPVAAANPTTVAATTTTSSST